MTIEEVKVAIEEILKAKTTEDRDMKLDYLLDNVAFDRSRINEIESDIEELKLEAHHLDYPISVGIIEEIMRKYKL